MSFKDKIIQERNEKLGLNNINTKLVFDTILKSYRELLLKAPKEILDYTLDIVITNVNGFNRLGSIEDLYSNYGDLYFIDINNSSFVSDVVDIDGSYETGDSIYFKEIDDLKSIKEYSISLKEIINICKENNCKIGLYTNENCNEPFTLEIIIQKPFDSNNKSIKTYLESLK